MNNWRYTRRNKWCLKDVVDEEIQIEKDKEFQKKVEQIMKWEGYSNW